MLDAPGLVFSITISQALPTAGGQYGARQPGPKTSRSVGRPKMLSGPLWPARRLQRLPGAG